MITLRIADQLRTEFLKFTILRRNVILQTAKFFSKFHNFFPTKCARGGARGHAGWFKITGAERRLGVGYCRGRRLLRCLIRAAAAVWASAV